MRKQATVDRIRAKKNASAALALEQPVDNNKSDLFHNGQTPSCRILLNAVQDVFPELRQQPQPQTNTNHRLESSSNKSSSSLLGQLLRWHVLETRRAKSKALAPPFSQQQQQQPTSVSASTSNNKKKKKRKKKKKLSSNETTMDISSHSVELEVELKESSELATAPAGTTSIVPLQSATDAGADGVQKPPSDSSGAHSQSSLLMFDQIVPDQDGDTIIDAASNHAGSPAGTTSIVPLQSAADADGVQKTPSDSSGAHSQSSLLMFDQIVPDQDGDTIIDAVSNHADSTTTTPATNIQAKSPSSTLTTTPTKGTKDESEVSHELIPPEAAEVPPEITPGDALVNPLEVPYLVSLESNDSRLTQGIDGSHIYAAGSTTDLSEQVTPLVSSSLNSRQSLVEDWLDQLFMVDKGDTTTTNHNHTIPKYRTLRGFLEYLTPLYTQSGNGIPLTHLLEACLAIDCMSCRQDAIADANHIQKQQQPQQKVSSENTNKSSHRLVLTTDCLQDRRDAAQEETVDAAFDYVALEEGHHVPAAEEAVDLETNISLMWVNEEQEERNAFSKTSPATTYTPQWVLQPLTEKHISSLVEQWLPCGIDEDVMVTTLPTPGPESLPPQSQPAVLDPQEFHAIKKNVLENVKDVRETCADVNQMGFDLRQTMNQVSASFANKNSSNLEYSTFPKLRDCDTSCNTYQEKLLEVMHMITSEKSHALQDMQLHLWTHYLRALNMTFEVCESYYTHVSDELADQLGVVPKMFVSAPLRSLYQTLVEEKVKIWTHLGQDIFAQALTTSVLKEWYTRQVWIDVRNTIHQNEESLQLDDACHDLVKSLSSWTETALGGRVTEIQRQRMSQTEHVLELLQTIIEPLAREYAKVERYFSQERNRYFASLRSNIILAQGVRQTMRLIDQKEVECMATGVVLMWRQMRLMTSRMMLSSKVPSLPLQLKRWMRQEHQYDEWPSSSLARDGRYCRAGCGGKRRVHCIMAGLIYNWLEDRCQEWNAELAEQELLGTFDMEDTTETSAISATTNNSNSGTANKDPITAKSSKSSRRKKKKKSAASSGHRPDTIQAGSNGNGAAREGVSFDESCEGFEEFADQELASPALVDVLPKEEEYRVQGNKANGDASNEFSEPDTELEENEEEHHEIDSYPSSVYIMDDKEILSAQDFLVGRLLEALEADDSMGVVYL